MKTKQKEMLSRQHHSTFLIHQLRPPGSRAAARVGEHMDTAPWLHRTALGLVGTHLCYAVLVKRACRAVGVSGEHRICSSKGQNQVQHISV